MVELSKKGEWTKQIWQKQLQFVALFIAVLVLSLPFYSANAMAASVTVTSNYGTDQIDGFLDAEGDTWTLEVDVETDDGEAVSPDQVYLVVGSSEIPFDSCSSSGDTSTCEFQSILENGISEGSYSFEVVLYDLVYATDDNSSELGSELASDTDSVVADGSGPSVTWNTAYQSEGYLHLDFNVEDDPNACVGLDEIKVVDAETGEVYETFDVSEEETCSFDYTEDGGNAGVFSVDLDGEGTRYFKIKATDLLGHEETTASKSVETDFVAPDVNTGSLLIHDFGDYVGAYSLQSDVSINVTECQDLDSVTATSDTVSFLSQEASCDEVDYDQCIWECTWSNLNIEPSGSSVSVSVTAIDEAGNSETSTASSSFTLDSTAPELVYFGTKYVYEDLSYVASGEDATIYAYINEDGAGINEDTIRANLQGIGGSSSQAPDLCEVDSSGEADYVCTFEVDVSGSSTSTSSAEINIVFLEDKVGNNAGTASTIVVVDGVEPKVLDVEFFGYSAAGQKDYFQSNDDLVIDLEVEESSGLQIYVDANELVMDAENIYQYGTYEEMDDGSEEYVASDLDGFVYFDENDCQRDSETANWVCELRIDSIKSGPDSSAEFEVLVMDTGSNEADWSSSNEPENVDVRDLYAGKFSLEIFALDEETQPDFWEQQGKAEAVQDFIDLDVVSLTYTTMFFDVNLHTDVGAQAAMIELDSCAPVDVSESENNANAGVDAPTLSRTLMYGGVFMDAYSSPSVDLVLEFEPFSADEIIDWSKYESEEDFQEEFESIDFDYQCNLRIYSVIEDTAINYAESQLVTVTVPFAYSSNGALDENIDAKIYDSIDNAWFKTLSVFGSIEKVLKWVSYAQRIVNLLISLVEFFDILAASFDAERATGFGATFATGACAATEGPKQGLLGFIKKIGFVLEIVTCNPSPSAAGAAATFSDGAGWYANYQRTVLDYWNTAKGGYVTDVIGIGLSAQSSVNTNYYEKGLDLLGSNVVSASLYDNVVVSVIGLCPAGVVHNMNKLRQIECGYVKCLAEDVKNGVTTVEVCEKTKGYMYCKYVMGEVLSVLPLDVFDFIANLFKSALLDPIGVAMSILSLSCTNYCTASGSARQYCDVVGFFYRLMEIVSNTISLVQEAPSVKYDICSEPSVKEAINYVKETRQAEKAEAKAANEDASVTTSDL